MKRLTPPQREALRRVADGKSLRGWHAGTIDALLRRALITGRSDSATRYDLTVKGERTHRDIMRSGDGPEALKELFRF